MKLGLPNLTYKCSTMSHGHLALLVLQGIKGQGYDVSVGLQTEFNIAAAAACISYAGFSLL